jgi:hypothetical protein
MRNEMCRNSGFETGLATTQNEDKRNLEGRTELQAKEAERFWLPEKLKEAN